MDQQEAEVKGWLSEILHENYSGRELHELLKDGVVLCNLINGITGAKSNFPTKSKLSFAQMENIFYFIENARKLGVPDSENFQTIDLYEGQNMQQVIHCLYSLSRNLNKNGRTDLPVIGPKLVDEVKISFNQEQINESKRTISLQYGHMRENTKYANKSIK